MSIDLKKMSIEKKELRAVKKATLEKHSDILTKRPIKVLETNKELPSDSEEIIYRTIIANTYYFMDSHGDVHVKGCFTKSIKEGKRFFLHDHEFKVSAKIGEFLATYEKEVEWSELGIDKEGTTIVLAHDVAIKKSYNESLFNQYKENKIDQHSVGMQYVNIELALNYPDDEEAYKLFHEFLPKLGNQETALESGYFWVIYEAKHRETSAVLIASNPITGVLDDNKTEKEVLDLLGNIENKEIIYNIVDSIKSNLLEEEPLKDTLKEAESAEAERKKVLLKLINI